jgi:hypothetical protein
MIKNICKRKHELYTSLPVLGSIPDDFTKFLNQLGYHPIAINRRLHVTPLIDNQLQHYRCHSIDDITQSLLLNCKRIFLESNKSIDVSATINLLIRYLDKTGRFSPKKLSLLKKELLHTDVILNKSVDLQKQRLVFMLYMLHNLLQDLIKKEDGLTYQSLYQQI